MAEQEGGAMGTAFDVVVVGAGYGGVTGAALLAERGRRVLVVDKNPQPGGKAMSLRRGGSTYEMWPIVGGPATGSRIEELMAVIGACEDVPMVTPERTGELRFIDADGSVFATPLGALPSSAFAAPDHPEVGQPELEAAIEMAGAMLAATDEELTALDTTDIATWMGRFGIGRVLNAHQMAILNLLFVAGVDRIPASEAIRTLRDFSLKGAGRYHAGGYARPAEVAVEYVAAHGGEYRPRTSVERIVVDGRRVTGVVVDGELIRAHAVVSNAGIQPTVLDLVGTEHFPGEYVERVRGLEPSWAFVGARYFLDAPVVDVPMVVQFSDQSWWTDDRFRSAEAGRWPDHPLLFTVVPSLYDASLAPDADHQVVLAGTMSSPDPQSPMGAEAIRRVDAEMRWTWPDVGDHIVKRETFTAANVSAATRASVVGGQGGECIGIAQVIGQCGSSKPDAVAPLDGLFFVGCDAGGYGCGTHQAVESGFVVADLVDAALG